MTEKSFVDLGREIGQLLEAKNLAYGNSFERSEEIMKVLYPDGIPVAAYQDALTVIRIIDKLFRIANAKGAFGEDPWRDIAGYSILKLWSEAKRPELNINLNPPIHLNTGMAAMGGLGGLNVEVR